MSSRSGVRNCPGSSSTRTTSDWRLPLSAVAETALRSVGGDSNKLASAGFRPPGNADLTTRSGDPPRSSTRPTSHCKKALDREDPLLYIALNNEHDHK